MRITRISAWQVDLPLHEGSYKWSGGKSVTVFDSTVVAVETDAGLIGHGEVCPLGPFYLPAYADGRAGRARGTRAAPPRRRPAATGASSTARWTPRSRGIRTSSRPSTSPAGTFSARRPACRFACCSAADTATTFTLYRAISQESPEAMAEKRRGLSRRGLPPLPAQGRRRPGYRHRAHPRRRAPCCSRATASSPTPTPAGCMHEAVRVVRAVRDVDVYIEQPCLSYEECLAVRRHTDHPFVLDEVIDGIDMLVRGHADRAMDVVNLKISKLGGLTKTRQARDLCVSLGIAMTLEDSWGGDIVTAAIAHLAHSTPHRVPLHRHRLQQLRHALDRRRRPAAQEWPPRGVHVAGPRDHSQARRVRAARGRCAVSSLDLTQCQSTSPRLQTAWPPP